MTFPMPPRPRNTTAPKPKGKSLREDLIRLLNEILLLKHGWEIQPWL